MFPRIVNPFYPLIMVMGVIFFVTAFAFSTMAVRHQRESEIGWHVPKGVPSALDNGTEASLTPHPLDRLMRRQGMLLLIVELVVLSIATFAAIGTDSFWERRSQRGILERPNGVSDRDRRLDNST